MRQKARSFLHLILGALLGLLGFSSCEFDSPVMYGEPHADFKAGGKVTDPSGKGIEGIRVAIQRHRHYANSANVIYDQNDWYEHDTVYTDASGRYEKVTGTFSRPDDVTVMFEDIDGEEHGGRFQPVTVTPEIKQTKQGKGWYTGAYEVEANARLEKE